MENINWYPGHMKKTKALIESNLKLVDAVIEVVDSRIPVSSRNPIVDQMISGKNRIIVLNKRDLSDESKTAEWIKKLTKERQSAIAMDSNKGTGKKELMAALDNIQKEKNRKTDTTRPIRIMIVGVPNVGKSSIINRLTGRKSTQTGDRPGVTNGKQWLTLENKMQLLDTPGILWPKFEDPKAGMNLAFCGSIKDEILDVETLGFELIKLLKRDYPELLMDRYKLESLSEDDLENMEEIARKRGFIMPGKRIDYTRCANAILDEFRHAVIGRITLESAKGD